MFFEIISENHFSLSNFLPLLIVARIEFHDDIQNWKQDWTNHELCPLILEVILVRESEWHDPLNRQKKQQSKNENRMYKLENSESPTVWVYHWENPINDIKKSIEFFYLFLKHYFSSLFSVQGFPSFRILRIIGKIV